MTVLAPLEVASFEVFHDGLVWPWVAFDANGKCFAFAIARDRIATRVLADDGISDGPRFSLPSDLRLPAVQAFTIGAAGALLAVVGAGVVVTSDASGELHRSTMVALAGAAGFTPRAVAFDRGGSRLWISAESDTETAVLFLDARSHAVLGVSRSAVFPPPAMHELHVHPQDDAVLLLANCGEDGTFARVVGWSGDAVEAVPTALDQGGIAAGFVGFSADVSRVHLAEADELRTHAWPTLHELSCVELADDFVSSYSGAVLGQHIFVDGQDADSGDDLVMRFDFSALRGKVLPLPTPVGMWAGRLGPDCIVTVESKGDPVRGRVIRMPLPDTSN